MGTLGGHHHGLRLGRLRHPGGGGAARPERPPGRDRSGRRHPGHRMAARRPRADDRTGGAGRLGAAGAGPAGVNAVPPPTQPSPARGEGLHIPLPPCGGGLGWGGAR
ncbi:hypothetical protein MTBUT4_110121 [Magnetospirillum sp. UT-4]|nr:hypothetical protein MTBUT4_110121 [Magnetospirillum sp. UT-4]